MTITVVPKEKREFNPINIVIDTKEDLDAMKAMLASVKEDYSEHCDMAEELLNNLNDVN